MPELHRKRYHVKCKWSLQFQFFFSESSEPIEWDPQGAFINNVATKVYYVLPAFLAGLMTGVIIWACYIFTFKIGNAVKKMTISKSSEPSTEEPDQEAYNPAHQEPSSPSVSSRTSSIASSEVEDQIIIPSIRSKGL